MAEAFVPYRQREVNGKLGPIKDVITLDGGVLQVFFGTGNYLMVHLQPYFYATRFYPLDDAEVWSSAKTNGRFVRWYKDKKEVVAIAWDELIQFAVGKEWF